jgi:hypothetical protein
MPKIEVSVAHPGVAKTVTLSYQVVVTSFVSDHKIVLVGGNTNETVAEIHIGSVIASIMDKLEAETGLSLKGYTSSNGMCYISVDKGNQKAEEGDNSSISW